MDLDYRIILKIDGTERSTGIVSGSMNLIKSMVSGEYSLGTMYADKFECELFGNLSDFAGKTLSVLRRKTGENDKYLFYGVIDSSTSDSTGYYRKIVAYDAFYFIRKKNIAYYWNQLWSGLAETDTKTVAQILTMVCTATGLSCDNASTLINKTMTVAKSEVCDYTTITFEAIMHALGEVNGCMWVTTGASSFKAVSLNPLQSATTVSDLENGNSSLEDYQTNKITSFDIYRTSDDLIQSVGSGNNSYPISGNIFINNKTSADITTYMTTVLNAIKDIQFTPCSLSLTIPNFSVNLGDKITSTLTIYGGTTKTITGYAMEIQYSGSQLTDMSISSIANGQNITQKPQDYSDGFIVRTETAAEIADLQTQINAKPSQSQVDSAIASAIATATRQITGANGGYVFIQMDANNKPQAFIISDKEDYTANDAKVWLWNKNGLGHSNTGINGTMTTAWTAGGVFNADFIGAGTINANNVNITNLHATDITVGSTDPTTVAEALETVEEKVDNTLQTFVVDETPTMSNYPTNTWDPSEYVDHIGDFCIGDFDTVVEGSWFKFTYDTEMSTYEWTQLKDVEIEKAISAAVESQATATSQQIAQSQQQSADSIADLAQQTADLIASIRTSYVSREDYDGELSEARQSEINQIAQTKVDEYKAEVEQWLDFSSSTGLIISAVGSPFRVVISNSKFAIQYQQQDQTWMDDDELHVKKLYGEEIVDVCGLTATKIVQSGVTTHIQLN